MVTEGKTPLGYTSEVHTSLLEPLLLFKQVPYRPGIVNFFGTPLIMISFRWWDYLLIGLLIHASMFLLTLGDPQRVLILLRLLWYRRYYGAC